jgi:signal transduction histidine kinase
MRERLALVGGTLTIESSPGSGTALVAHVPLAGPDSDGDHVADASGRDAATFDPRH